MILKINLASKVKTEQFMQVKRYDLPNFFKEKNVLFYI